MNTEDDFIGIAAIAAAAAADVLTRLGYATEVKLCAICWVRRTDRLMVCSFPVKEAFEPLDVQNILQIANPGLLRSLYFEHLYVDLNPGDRTGGTGRPHTKECKEAAGIDFLITKEWSTGADSQELVIEGLLNTLQVGDYVSEQSVPQYLR